MNKKVIITFAGMIGSSKSPIAHYLSCMFGLPIFNVDAIRSEVTEDYLEFNLEEFCHRREERLKDMAEKNESFILDASIDRNWQDYKETIGDLGYKVFIISIDLSKEFITRLYQAKGYDESLKRIDTLYDQHEEFLKNFGQDVSLHIGDAEFHERLMLSENKFREWLS